MSFALTTEQVRNHTKTVTRRAGWRFLRPGDQLRAVDRCMGLRPGEHPVTLALVEVVSVRRERLGDMAEGEPAREGFPQYTVPELLVQVFYNQLGLDFYSEVTRIEFRYIDEVTP